MNDWLKDKVEEHKKGSRTGIFSVCSAHPVVLKAVAQIAKDTENNILIESTCNQVNQDGGYTKMQPSDFISFVGSIMEKEEIPRDRVIFGGDHLGPYPWRHLSANRAMDKASELIISYVKAGYTKIHLDPSMKCSDDTDGPLSKTTIAKRTAFLCKVAETTNKKYLNNKLSYVIGTEVPTPGGLTANTIDTKPTSVQEVSETLNLMYRAFIDTNLETAWNKVIAVVVQPGVEFSNTEVFEYNPSSSIDLTNFIKNIGNLVYEAHSTDFQTSNSLRTLVRNHFMILKVGPALTYKFREAIFALAHIEDALFSKRDTNKSLIIQTIDQIMSNNPDYWQGYYDGSPLEVEINRHFSFSDRIRYYWSDNSVNQALKKLIANLDEKTIPISLISQYFPIQFNKIQCGILDNSPMSLIIDHIKIELLKYVDACRGD